MYLSLIKDVPQRLKNDPGLIYERMRWRRKAKLENGRGFTVNEPTQYKLRTSRNWWINSRIIVRRLIHKKKYSKGLREY